MTAVTIPGLEHAPTNHARLLAWVQEVAELTCPDEVVWADGSQEEWDRLTQKLVDAGTFVPLKKKPNSFWAASDPSDVARVEERTYICSVREEDSGADEQLDGPFRDEGHHDRALPGLHAWPHDVRDPVLHGPADRGEADARCRDHRLGVRRRLDAHHDPHGHQGARTLFGRGRAVRARAALARRTARGRPGRRASGRATRPSTSRTSRRPARSGATAPATAATPCWARSATRCASPRPWRATRAGSPSTC